MILHVTNDPRAYAWGSRRAISELLGRPPGGGPEAELWLGAHPLCPSRIVSPVPTGDPTMLDEWVAANPDLALGQDRASDELPFLLKVLAADDALSIQVHPDATQARHGFEAENRRGVPADSAERTYKDPRHKPELAWALSDRFEALVGFRPVGSTRRLLARLVDLAGPDDEIRRPLAALAAELDGPAEGLLRRLVALFLSPDCPRDLLAAVVTAAGRADGAGPFGPELHMLAYRGARRPSDRGVLVALLLNHVRLVKGQAVYLPPGVVHSYLSGTAVEVMAASDNVVRGGWTDKRIDADELQRIASFEPTTQPICAPESPAPGTELFTPHEPDFALAVLDPSGRADDGGTRSSGRAAVALTGPAVALAVQGTANLAGARHTTVLSRGQSAFVTPDERELRVSGEGRVVVAQTNPAALDGPR